MQALFLNILGGASASLHTSFQLGRSTILASLDCPRLLNMPASLPAMA